MNIFIAILLFFASCRSKYDTSKALDILPTGEITMDFGLKDSPFQVDENTQTANITNGTKSLSRIGFSIKSIENYDNVIFTATNNKITATSLNNLAKKTSKSHKIINPMLEIQRDFILIFNTKGTFEVLKSDTLATVWSGRVGLTDAQFAIEQRPKSLLSRIREKLKNKHEQQVFTLSSSFACANENCYATTAEGVLVILNVVKKQVQMAQILPPQDITLHNLYKPKIANGNIIFSSGNSEFIIFNIAKQAVIGQSSFANEDTASMFDINLVKEIYTSNDTILISHLNGVYAFNIKHGTSLWNKNLLIDSALISGNYIIFFETKTQKLVCMNISTGEAKWITSLKFPKSHVKFLTIANHDDGYRLLVGTQSGIEAVDFQEGTHLGFTKMNLANVKHSFIHNEIFYYINKNNIYRLK